MKFYKLTLLLKSIFFSILMLFVFSSCEEELQREIYEPSDNRTFLLYIVGDNSLSSNSVSNINSIKEGMYSSKGAANILVYEDSKRKEEDGTDSKPTLWKFYLANGKVIQELVKEYPEQNSVEADIMTGIISDVFSLYPAQEKVISFWGHGSGWLPKPTKSSSAMQLAYGPDVDTWLDITELKDILDDTGLHFDAIMFDACNMACIEVAYELKDNADYMILSPAEIMANGYPYKTIIPVLSETILDYSKICDKYMEYYDGSQSYYDGTISLIRTSEIETLARLYGEFLLKYQNKVQDLDGSDIQQLGRKSLGYNNVFFDLRSVTKSIMTAEELSAFDLQLEKTVLCKGYTKDFVELELKDLCGLTVFLPHLYYNIDIIPYYYKLSFSKSLLVQ